MSETIHRWTSSKWSWPRFSTSIIPWCDLPINLIGISLSNCLRRSFVLFVMLVPSNSGSAVCSAQSMSAHSLSGSIKRLATSSCAVAIRLEFMPKPASIGVSPSSSHALRAHVLPIPFSTDSLVLGPARWPEQSR